LGRGKAALSSTKYGTKVEWLELGSDKQMRGKKGEVRKENGDSEWEKRKEGVEGTLSVGGQAKEGRTNMKGELESQRRGGVKPNA